jgi:hypothetical protein
MLDTNPQFIPTPAQYEAGFAALRTWLVQNGITTPDRAVNIKPPAPGQKPSWFGMIVATRLIAIGCKPAPEAEITPLHRYFACAAWNAELDMDRNMSSREVVTDQIIDPCERFIAALIADWLKRNAGAAGAHASADFDDGWQCALKAVVEKIEELAAAPSVLD